MASTNPTPTPPTHPPAEPIKGAPARPTPPPAASTHTPDPERISSGYSLPAKLHDDLRTAAKERGLTASYLVEKALQDYLPRLIPVDELALVRPPASGDA